MSNQNVLLLMADEHSKYALGCYGNEIVRTPNLDHLAARGTLFTNAYCNSPICVPARASLATGRYPHDIPTWDNSSPYDGKHVQSWGHRLTAHGVDVVTVGKLHFADSSPETGFPDQRVSMHVHNGVGNPIGLLRGRRPKITGGRDFVLRAGPGETEYHRFDLDVADTAVRWLSDEAPKDRPWVLQVSFVSPHFPLVVPKRYFDLYAGSDIPLPVQHAEEEWPHHPALDFHRRWQGNDVAVSDDAIRNATRAYYGLVSFVDEQVGRILDTAAAAGVLDDTLVIYTSDHGELLGAHGLWKKSSMYEQSVGVPLLMAGPGIPQAQVSDVNVSLVDVFPTVLEATGTPPAEADSDLPGMALQQLVSSGIERSVFAEYHNGWSTDAIYMLRDERFKYVHYVGAAPQLFDLETDPLETADLAQNYDYAAVLRRMERALCRIVDPEATDNEAKKDQRRRIEACGGVEKLLQRGDKFTYTPAPDSYAPAMQTVGTDAGASVVDP